MIYSWTPFLYSCIFQGYLGAVEFLASAAAGMLDRNRVSGLWSLAVGEGNVYWGGYILPRKCAAGFRGDRLCLLQICHTANGQPGTGCFTNVKEKRAVNKRTSVLREGLPPPLCPLNSKQ